MAQFWGLYDAWYVYIINRVQSCDVAESHSYTNRVPWAPGTGTHIFLYVFFPLSSSRSLHGKK